MVSAGTVLAFFGLVVGCLAMAWLLGTHPDDPSGVFDKYFAMARLGSIFGAALLLGGVTLVVAGIVNWRRHPRPLTRRLTLERTLVDRTIYLGFALAVIGVGIAFAYWPIAVVGAVAAVFSGTILILAAMVLHKTPAADLDRILGYIRPTLRWRSRDGSNNGTAPSSPKVPS